MSGPRHLPAIEADMRRLVREQTAVSRSAVNLKGHDKTRALRRCEELGRQLSKLRDEQLRAKGLK